MKEVELPLDSWWHPRVNRSNTERCRHRIHRRPRHGVARVRCVRRPRDGRLDRLSVGVTVAPPLECTGDGSTWFTALTTQGRSDSTHHACSSARISTIELRSSVAVGDGRRNSSRKVICLMRNRRIGSRLRDEAHAAVSPRPPNSSHTIIARTEGYTYATQRLGAIYPSFRGQFLSPRAKPYSSDSRNFHITVLRLSEGCAVHDAREMHDARLHESTIACAAA